MMEKSKGLIVQKIKEMLAKYEYLKSYDIDIAVSEENIVTFCGEVNAWQHVVDIGHIAGSLPEVYSVVNNITVKGLEIPKPDYSKEIQNARKKRIVYETDVLIIGAGISGCAIARVLSKYQLRVAVTEMHDDVCMGASKANSGAVHPGHMVKPGTLKAKLNVKGNAMYDEWAKELNFAMKKRGSIGVAYEKIDGEKLKKIHAVAQMNGVPGCQFITLEQMRKLEPNIPGEPVVILRNITMGCVEPYEVVLALANSAAINGVKFLLGNPVYAIERKGNHDFFVITCNGIITTKYVINAAGVHADDIAEMVNDKFYTIHARRGTIPIFDKAVRYPYNRGVGTVSRTANAESKGGGCGLTPEGNIQSGPSAVETPYKDDTASYKEDLDYAMQRAYDTVSYLKPSDVITFFTGVRAADYKEDFIIEMSKKVPGFIHVAAIQSPGLASAPAIAEMVENILLEDVKESGNSLEKNPTYTPFLAPKSEFRNMTLEQQDELIRKNPKYGHVICRCETITEGEILDAIHSPIVPTSVDAIKRRTRAGMGRCQGGFCQQKVVEILARELGKDWMDINLKDDGSYILDSKNRAEEIKSQNRGKDELENEKVHL